MSLLRNATLEDSKRKGNDTLDVMAITEDLSERGVQDLPDKTDLPLLVYKLNSHVKEIKGFISVIVSDLDSLAEAKENHAASLDIISMRLKDLSGAVGNHTPLLQNVGAAPVVWDAVSELHHLLSQLQPFVLQREKNLVGELRPVLSSYQSMIQSIEGNVNRLTSELGSVKTAVASIHSSSFGIIYVR